jgi:hypothetical protein
VSECGSSQGRPHSRAQKADTLGASDYLPPPKYLSFQVIANTVSNFRTTRLLQLGNSSESLRCDVSRSSLVKHQGQLPTNMMPTTHTSICTHSGRSNLATHERQSTAGDAQHNSHALPCRNKSFH